MLVVQTVPNDPYTDANFSDKDLGKFRIKFKFHQSRTLVVQSYTEFSSRTQLMLLKGHNLELLHTSKALKIQMNDC